MSAMRVLVSKLNMQAEQLKLRHKRALVFRSRHRIQEASRPSGSEQAKSESVKSKKKEEKKSDSESASEEENK